jgi:hypothetical protein
MSLPAVRRLIMVAAALFLVAAIGAPATLAYCPPHHNHQCYNACMRQYNYDKKACYDAYRAAYRLVKQQMTCCRWTWCRTHNYPGMTVYQCLQDAKNKKRAAEAQKRACVNAARTKYNNCRYACDHPTHSAP